MKGNQELTINTELPIGSQESLKTQSEHFGVEDTIIEVVSMAEK